jgi:hypothetical protein
MPKSITWILGPSDANETTEAPTDLRGVRAILRRWYVASRTIIERDSTPKLLRDPALYGIALATLVLCAQYWLYVHWLGDEGIFLHAAVRILGGEVLYRDFFELLPPGSFLAVAAWMKLFGAGLGSMRALAICVIVAIAALLYAAAGGRSGGQAGNERSPSTRRAIEREEQGKGRGHRGRGGEPVVVDHGPDALREDDPRDRERCRERTVSPMRGGQQRIAGRRWRR